MAIPQLVEEFDVFNYSKKRFLRSGNFWRKVRIFCAAVDNEKGPSSHSKIASLQSKSGLWETQELRRRIFRYQIRYAGFEKRKLLESLNVLKHDLK